ncbi:hypothetical protein F383_22095 [Gossypium arboreum]|uniref:Uncharacterized protein n=1 Tax=Gossypium arboreum TaxID=29729 RepID=A0A0B0NVG8_GOSAR|nr:hypothetical protein F383_22095 [Gossypium arboreum]
MTEYIFAWELSLRVRFDQVTTSESPV